MALTKARKDVMMASTQMGQQNWKEFQIQSKPEPKTRLDHLK